MDDYYDLLGVEPGAATADIKSAYRDKKAALDAKGDKGAVARLNKAWNVLSDPYQRGRYDAAARDGGRDRRTRARVVGRHRRRAAAAAAACSNRGRRAIGRRRRSRRSSRRRG